MDIIKDNLPLLLSGTSDLPAGTAGTGRVHPATGRAGTDRRFFFSKPYAIRLILVIVAGTRVRGYSGTRVGRSGTGRVGRSNVITVY
jgi:hypothetical protein